MGRIKIKSRDLEINIKGSQHMFIVYEYDNGKSYVVSGGPKKTKNGYLGGILFGHLIVKKEEYKLNNGKEPVDWENKDDNFKTYEIELSDEELKQKEVLIKEEISRINSSFYDYELPVVEAIIGDGVGDYNDQNSNTIVKAILSSIGYENELRTFVVENGLNVPGYNSELKNLKRDRTIENLAQKLYKKGKTVIDFLREIALKLEFELDSLVDDNSNLFEDLTKAWLRNSGIDPNKPVIVLKETSGGRNIRFADQLNGRLMDREEFVALIESGAYKGYTVKEINNISTPVSIPDGKEDNNLG